MNRQLVILVGVLYMHWRTTAPADRASYPWSWCSTPRHPARSQYQVSEFSTSFMGMWGDFTRPEGHWQNSAQANNCQCRNNVLHVNSEPVYAAGIELECTFNAQRDTAVIHDMTHTLFYSCFPFP
jgi:hypothetical protein